MSSMQIQPRPTQRLTSLRNAATRRIGRGRSTTPSIQQKPKETCCENPQIEDSEHGKVCTSCWQGVTDSNIVSEVTFGETSAGAAVVQGGFIADDARHANTMGPNRRAGGGTSSHEQTISNGKIAIESIAGPLRIPEPIINQAVMMYRLASATERHFVQGRRVQLVAAACLYAVCRRNKDNTIMLMDLAQVCHVSHFKLGTIYEDLRHSLCLGEDGGRAAVSSIRPFQAPEPLIEKFARKLEFGNKFHKVVEDALKLLSRMKRDWMVTGRQPAGICGACIIMAARMNDFRRSTREVVYVVRVADQTIYQRLQEFKQTVSSRLTIDQFRKFGPKVKKSRDPPSFLRARQKEAAEAKEKRHQERRDRGEASDSDEEAEGEHVQLVQSVEPEDHGSQPIRRSARQAAGTADTSGALPTPESSQRGSTGTRGTTDTHRRDSEGFLIPNPPKRKRGRPPKDRSNEPPAPPRKKRKRDPAPMPTEEDLAIEEELEQEIESIIQDPEVQAEAEQQRLEEAEARAQSLAEEFRSRTPFVEDAEEICNDEFEDDPEVTFCRLSDAEIAIKERIWVTANEDWLRQQQARELKKKRIESEGSGQQPKTRRKKKSSDAGDQAESPAQSPAEATMNMLNKKGGRALSKFLNYEMINRVYGESNKRASSVDSSTSGSVRAGAQPQDAVVISEDEDDDESVVEEPNTQPRRPDGEEEEEDDDDDEVEDEDDHLRAAVNNPRILLGGDPDAEEDEFGVLPDNYQSDYGDGENYDEEEEDDY